MLKLLLVFCFNLWICACWAQIKKKIWIDTDNKFGKFNRDVDDHLAIISCLNHDSFEIVGIGLARAGRYGAKVSRKLLKEYSPNLTIPVYEGAIHSRDTAATPASLALQECLKKAARVIVKISISQSKRFFGGFEYGIFATAAAKN